MSTVEVDGMRDVDVSRLLEMQHRRVWLCVRVRACARVHVCARKRATRESIHEWHARTRACVYACVHTWQRAVCVCLPACMAVCACGSAGPARLRPTILIVSRYDRVPTSKLLFVPKTSMMVLCIDMCIDVCIDMCLEECTDMRRDVYPDRCTAMCTDMPHMSLRLHTCLCTCPYTCPCACGYA